MASVLSKSRQARPSPDLYEFRKRYPLTVTNFARLADREAWLRRIWELDAHWQLAAERDSQAEEIVVRGAPPAHLPVEAEFEIIYAGGALSLLHGAVMSCHYKRRVLVVDTGTSQEAPRGWNISDEELCEFERAHLFTKGEIEAAVLNRYRSSFVKFHDAASRVKTPPLWMEGVLDVSIEADKLLALATSKLQASATHSQLIAGARLRRVYVQPDKVTVEIEDARTKRASLFSARLFVDASGANSLIARQINDGRKVTHVCPTVGTISRGFTRGAEPNRVDFTVGEILVSNEDARDHRQLIWEGFAGSPARDEYATYLFFYDAVDSPANKSLLALFERYFEQLPRYKQRGAQWQVLKPVFGYVPDFRHRGWKNQKRVADNRVMLIGEAARPSSPLTFCGFGSHARSLRRLTHLTELALKADLLDAASLSEMSILEPRVAHVSGFAEFLRPTPRSAPSAVNETFNALMAALHSLDERVRRELFQDRLSLSGLKRLLSRTAKLYPRIFQRLREHFGARGTFWWMATIAEAAFSERRKRLASQPEDDQGALDDAQEFDRHLRLYKERVGGGEP